MSATGAAGLILAAGGGSRFGPEPKLLADLNGRPLLEHAVRALTAVEQLDPVVVVLGAHAERVRREVHFGRARTVICEDWKAGMSASLRCGVGEISDAPRLIVALGDAPTLNPEIIRRFLTAPPGTRATYAGRPGHPVVLGPEQMARVMDLAGDTGARGLLAAERTIECGDLASGRDVDTPADLDDLRTAD